MFSIVFCQSILCFLLLYCASATSCLQLHFSIDVVILLIVNWWFLWRNGNEKLSLNTAKCVLCVTCWEIVCYDDLLWILMENKLVENRFINFRSLCLVWKKQRQDDIVGDEAVGSAGPSGAPYAGNAGGIRPYPHRDYTLHFRPSSGANTASDSNNGIFSSISNGFNSLVTNLFGWSFVIAPRLVSIARQFAIIFIVLLFGQLFRYRRVVNAKRAKIFVNKNN